MHKRSLGTAMVSAALLVGVAAAAEPLPALRDRQLLVDGKPYLALGGELHNSSASSPDYMIPVWDKLQAMHVRTVVSTVSWEDSEPKEGQFDFSLVDAQIAEARKRDMRIVLIWFGAFKNASSTYAPAWVRANTSRFPRAVGQVAADGDSPLRRRSPAGPTAIPAGSNALRAWSCITSRKEPRSHCSKSRRLPLNDQ